MAALPEEPEDVLAPPVLDQADIDVEISERGGEEAPEEVPVEPSLSPPRPRGPRLGLEV